MKFFLMQAKLVEINSAFKHIQQDVEYGRLFLKYKKNLNHYNVALFGVIS